MPPEPSKQDAESAGDDGIDVEDVGEVVPRGSHRTSHMLTGRGTHVVEDKDDVEVVVEFERNTWTAFFLFFVTLDNGNSVYTIFERLSIVSAMATTWLVQGVLVAVIWLRLTSNPFDEQAISQMLRFRVLQGHSFGQVQSETGRTYLQVLCDEETSPWGWEAKQYEEITRYLEGYIPGWSLTVLGLVGWVSCCAVEYRAAIEQAFAILALPRTPHDVSTGCTVALDEECMHITSFSPFRKMQVLFLITLPRLFIMLTLLCAGCVYLCNTLSVEDLVLNAMALIFVLEMDELIYAVCATHRAQKIVSGVEPLTFTVWRLPGGAIATDLFRIAFCWTCLVLSCSQLLFPFIDAVQAGKDALCGGETAASFHAHTPLGFMHVLPHHRETSECPAFGHEFQQYVGEMYNVSNHFNESTSSSGDLKAVEDARLKTMLEFVFREHKRETLPTALVSSLKILHAEPGKGHAAHPEACNRFNPALGITTCGGDGSSSQEACAWSYDSYLCEDWPAFTMNKIKQIACDPKPTSNFSCALWNMSGHANPFSFCQDEKINGSFRVNFRNVTLVGEHSFYVYSEYYTLLYWSALAKFLELKNGFAGQVSLVSDGERRLERMEGETSGRASIKVAVHLMGARRLGHQFKARDSRQGRVEIGYEIFIPFPNTETGFEYSAREIYNRLAELSSSASDSKARFESLLREAAVDVTGDKMFRDACALSVSHASAPDWLAAHQDSSLADLADDYADNNSFACAEPEICFDFRGWEEVCQQFDSLHLCDKNGTAGEGWNATSFGNFSAFHINGSHPVFACCACGGGSNSSVGVVAGEMRSSITMAEAKLILRPYSLYRSGRDCYDWHQLGRFPSRTYCALFIATSPHPHCGPYFTSLASGLDEGCYCCALGSEDNGYNSTRWDIYRSTWWKATCSGYSCPKDLLAKADLANIRCGQDECMTIECCDQGSSMGNSTVTSTVMAAVNANAAAANATFATSASPLTTAHVASGEKSGASTSTLASTVPEVFTTTATFTPHRTGGRRMMDSALDQLGANMVDLKDLVARFVHMEAELKAAKAEIADARAEIASVKAGRDANF